MAHGKEKQTSEKKVIKSPLLAIKAYCRYCCNESAREVTLCPTEECPLHAFRKGVNPYAKRSLTDKQRKAAAKRLAAAVESKKEE